MLSAVREIQASIHVVLDIDGTLGSVIVNENNILPKLQIFQQQGLIIKADGIAHIIHPGAIEFIQLLFSKPNIKISFFSSGPSKRNHEFVEKLLILAFGKKHYQYLQRNQLFTIYSKEHMEKISQEMAVAQERKYLFSKGYFRKNLHQIQADIKNMVLIDDDISYVYLDQLGNMLKVKLAEDLAFFSDNLEDKDADSILRCNHLFYAVGVLQKALLMMDTKKYTLSNALLELQYKQDADGRYDLKSENINYYLSGANILKTFNSTLDFYGGDIAREKIESNIKIETMQNPTVSNTIAIDSHIRSKSLIAYSPKTTTNSLPFDNGNWDFNIHYHSLTKKPIFIYRVYQAGIEVGSASFYMHPLLCRAKLGDQHNMISTTGIFSQFKIDVNSIEDICAELPPSTYEEISLTLCHSVQHGVLCGTSNLIHDFLQITQVPKHIANTIHHSIYYGGYFLLSYNQYTKEEQNENVQNNLNAFYYAIVKTGSILLTNLFLNRLTQTINDLSHQALNNEQHRLGKVLGYISNYGIYACNVTQQRVTTTLANIAIASGVQTFIEKSGRTLLNRFFKPAKTKQGELRHHSKNLNC